MSISVDLDVVVSKLNNKNFIRNTIWEHEILICVYGELWGEMDSVIQNDENPVTLRSNLFN